MNDSTGARARAFLTAVGFDPEVTDEYLNAITDALPEDVHSREAIVAAATLMMTISRAGGYKAIETLGMFAGALVTFYGTEGAEALNKVTDRVLAKKIELPREVN